MVLQKTMTGKTEPKTLPPQELGRPSSITLEIIEVIGGNIRVGMPQVRAATLAGISIRTYYYWIAKANEILDDIDKADEKGEELIITETESLYVALLHAVSVAEAGIIYEAVESIKSEGPNGYKFILERLYRKEFGPRHRLDVGDGEELEREIQLGLPGLIEENTD